jgi:hypothetical protein
MIKKVLEINIYLAIKFFKYSSLPNLIDKWFNPSIFLIEIYEVNKIMYILRINLSFTLLQ